MIRINLVFALLGLTACHGAPNQQNTVDLCTQTVRDYAVLRDEGPAEDYADLFVTGGTFELGGVVTTGRDALIARHESANNAALWRHNMTDIRITPTDGGATGVSRFIIYTGSHPAPAAAARRIVGDYIDTFAVEGGMCKIKSRKVQIMFDSPA